MPTFRHGKSAYIGVIVGGSTAVTKLSTSFDDSGLQRTVDSAEVTVYGDNDKKYLAGLRSGTFSFKGHFDKTLSGTLAGLLGASTNPTFHYGPESTAASRRKYVFGAVVTGFNIGSPVGDKVSYELTATVSGAVTSTTF